MPALIFTRRPSGLKPISSKAERGFPCVRTLVDVMAASSLPRQGAFIGFPHRSAGDPKRRVRVQEPTRLSLKEVDGDGKQGRS